MNDKKKEIAEKYMLPERPFLYGMASAFDLFGVLGQGRSEQLLANLQEDMRQRSERDIMRAAVGQGRKESLPGHKAVRDGKWRKNLNASEER